MKYSVIITPGYGVEAHCPALPGCKSQRETFEEAMENIKDAIATYLRIHRRQEIREANVYHN